VFHSATWDHDYDLTDKRVAVVGTGASAVQFVPQIQPKVARLHLYQRTPPWVIPRRDRPIGAGRRWLFRRFPPARLAVRAGIYLRLELLLGPVVLGHSARRSSLLQRLAASHLAAQVKDPELRASLRPDYAIGCKRILASDDYYPALDQPNVELVTSAVTGFGADCVLDEHGGSRQVDAVILGTGFQAAEPSFAQRIHGLGGRPLSRTWAEGMEAYLGSTVPGFPNLFLMIGPNTTLGHNSMVYMIESQVNYLTGALDFLGRPGVATVEVRPEVTSSYNRRLQADMEGTAWTSGGCTSWYLDHRGRNTTLWPGPTWRFRQLTRRFHPADYSVTAG
jgi:cation diffusion facilitator CzcD-associated flavoprotein CzcO